jgi:hypothetical protein
MDQLKWLELAVAKDSIRPALTWGYQIELLGEPITITSNGYAAHWVYAQQWDDILTFKKSEYIETAASWITRCPQQFESIVDVQVCLRVCVNALSLAQAFKVTKGAWLRGSDHGFVKLWYEPGGKLHIFQLGDAGDVYTTINAQSIGEDRPRPLRMCFQRKLITDALKMFHTDKHGDMIELNFGCNLDYQMSRVILGKPGIAEAVVMSANAGDVRDLEWWNSLPTR